MKRYIAMLLVAAVALLALATLVPTQAGATHSLPHLLRQVERLEKQVGELRRQVRSINADLDVVIFDLFVCTFPAEPPTVFSDGTIGYPLFYDSLCLGSSSAKARGIDVDRELRTP